MGGGEPGPAAEAPGDNDTRLAQRQGDRTGPKPIRASKIILAEGTDAYWFFVWAYQEFGATGIDVRDFEGNEKLRPHIEALKLDPNFEMVETLVVARDAEVDAQAALRSVVDALADAGLPKPEKAFTFAGGTTSRLKTAVMIFPGYEGSDRTRRLANGTLEDLCLRTIAPSDRILPCLTQYMECISRLPDAPVHPKKTRLHAYLAAKNDHAGLKLGEAIRAKAWDLGHEAVAPFKATILAM